MDQQQFTAWKRALSSVPCRRDVLRWLGGAGLGLGALRLSGVVARKKHTNKRKKKNKKKKKSPQPAFNQYGCLEVGQPCRGDSSLCCSGICEGTAPKKGKPDRRVCAAHDTGTCKQDGVLAPCNNRTNCGCFRTTAGSDVCAELFPPSACAAC